MDPISLTASVITVLGLIHKLSMTCLDFHSKVKSARRNVDHIMDELNLLRSVLEGLARIIPMKEQESTNFCDLVTIAAPYGPLWSCHTELEELEGELSTATSTDSKFGISSVSWALKEKEINRRLGRISTAKQSLQLAMTVDHT